MSVTSLVLGRQFRRFCNVPALVVAGATLALLLRDAAANFVGRSDLAGDAAGHLALAQFSRDYLLPGSEGWNPRFFCGFPPGELYPPLFHALAGALGKFISIEAAYRAVVGASVLCVPIGFYLLCRAHAFEPARARQGGGHSWDRGGAIGVLDHSLRGGSGAVEYI